MALFIIGISGKSNLFGWNYKCINNFQNLLPKVTITHGK